MHTVTSRCCISAADELYQLMLVVPTNERGGFICGPQPDDVQWRSILAVVGVFIWVTLRNLKLSCILHIAYSGWVGQRRIFPQGVRPRCKRKVMVIWLFYHPALPAYRSQWLLQKIPNVGRGGRGLDCQLGLQFWTGMSCHSSLIPPQVQEINHYRHSLFLKYFQQRHTLRDCAAFWILFLCFQPSRLNQSAGTVVKVLDSRTCSHAFQQKQS